MQRSVSLPRVTALVAFSLPALLCAPLIGILPAAAQNQDTEPTITAAPKVLDSTEPIDAEDRFIVKFRDTAKGSPAGNPERGKAYGRVARLLGVPVQEIRSDAGLSVVESTDQLTREEASQVVDVLMASPEVEYAEVDTFLRPTAMAPNDSFYPRQWDLFEDTGGIRVSGAWDRSTGDGQTVAVIDTGITGHSDLNEQIVPGYDFITDPAIARDSTGRDDNPLDEGAWCGTGTSSWHGTHVAGTIGAATNNNKGIAGIAYQAKVQPIRAIGACGGYMSDVADAINWAVGGTVSGIPNNPTPARVVNLSLGASAPCSMTFQNTLTYASSKGAVVVVAAGNENQPVANSSPANCDNVLVVGATGRDGARSPYSNYGDKVDVSAPGGNMATGTANGIASTWNSGTTTPAMEGYSYMQGTSMAAPHAAGVAALMLAANPALTPSQIEDTIRNSARPLPGACDTGGCGTGLLDATAALATLPGSPTPPVPVPLNLSTATPTITGSAAVGATLTAEEGVWGPAPAEFSYQWTRNGTPIPLATTRTYTAIQMDLAQDLAVTVTGTKAGYAPASETSAPVTVRPFIDVDANRVFASEIAWLATTGVSNGWAEPNGTRTYRPTLAVSRDVMAAFMYRLAGRPAYTPPATSPFTDIPTNHVFYKEIAWLATTGVSNGWAEPNGTRTYRPTLAVSRDVMATFMYRYTTTATSS